MGAGLCEGYQAVGGRSTSAPAALQPAPTRLAGRKKIMFFSAGSPGDLPRTSSGRTGIAAFTRLNNLTCTSPSDGVLPAPPERGRHGGCSSMVEHWTVTPGVAG